MCGRIPGAVTRFDLGVEVGCWAGHPMEVVSPQSSEAGERPRLHLGTAVLQRGEFPPPTPRERA